MGSRVGPSEEHHVMLMTSTCFWQDLTRCPRFDHNRSALHITHRRLQSNARWFRWSCLLEFVVIDSWFDALESATLDDGGGRVDGYAPSDSVLRLCGSSASRGGCVL